MALRAVATDHEPFPAVAALEQARDAVNRFQGQVRFCEKKRDEATKKLERAKTAAEKAEADYQRLHNQLADQVGHGKRLLPGDRDRHEDLQLRRDGLARALPGIEEEVRLAQLAVSEADQRVGNATRSVNQASAEALIELIGAIRDSAAPHLKALGEIEQQLVNCAEYCSVYARKALPDDRQAPLYQQFLNALQRGEFRLQPAGATPQTMSIEQLLEALQANVGDRNV